MVNKAKKILAENGWFNDFYYILKVMASTEENDTTVHVAVTRQWGCKVLDNKLDYLVGKYPSLKNDLKEETYWYFHELHMAGEHAYNVILDKILNEDKNYLIDEKKIMNSHDVAKHIERNE